MEAAVEQTTTTITATGDQADGQTATTITVTGGEADGVPVDYNGDHDGGPKDITNNIVAKGKRTKRQRPQSPILFTFSSTNINNDLTYYSPVSSSGFPAGSTTTEDEDTAESLILLSKGHSLDLFTSKRNRDDNYDGVFKFNSKKYIESSSTGSGGVYVYECKTCSRTFPSFQALGGHRASHRKPKNNDVDIRKPQPYKVVIDNNEPPPLQLEFPSRNNNYSSMNYPPPPLNNRVSFIGNTIKSSSKLHECSICGTEFNSGQALGGHMRRHRVAGGGNRGGNNTITTNNKNTNNTMLSLIPFGMVTNAEVYDLNSKNDDALRLGLDLNLPAPRETTVAATMADSDHQQQLSFALPPTTTENNETKEQPVVHLSAAPTLVDCHY